MDNKTDNFNAAIKLVKYFITARHRKGHGIHSPVVFDLVSKVLCDKHMYADYKTIQQQVKRLKTDTTLLEYTEYGAGSKLFSNRFRKVSDIAGKSGIKQKYGRLLFRMAGYYKSETIVELGTSIGISTLYLSKGAGEGTKVYTIEANQALVEHARQSALALNCTNINFVCGNFDSVLPGLIPLVKSPALVFIDGNHTYEATIHYFKVFKDVVKSGFIIIDDIYWSREMEKAWNEIKQLSDVTIDLYSMGIIIIGEMLTPGNYTIRF